MYHLPERGARSTAVDAQHRYRDLVEGIDAIVWEADVDTQAFTFVNRRAETMLGWPAEQWLQPEGYFERIVHPADRGRDQIEQAADHVPAADRQAELKQQALADSGVQTMLDVFGGEIKEIEEM